MYRNTNVPFRMGSEDFVYFTVERPRAIMRLRCSNEKRGIVHSLHSPYFDIDETVLEIGTEIFYEAVKCYLSPSKKKVKKILINIFFY